MTCANSKPLIELYADGELDAAKSQELEHHFQACGRCRHEWSELRLLRNELKQDALYFRAPQGFARRLRTELRKHDENKPSWKFWAWNWSRAATAGALAICLIVLFAIILAQPSSEERLRAELISSHIRSLMANHVVDVASSDQHTVKPWFNGKLEFSPPVKDLAPQGFPLVGGRLDYICGHTAAALVFQRQKHIINLMVWPTEAGDATLHGSPPLQGYHLIHWVRGGMTFWAISDLNQTELADFVREFAAQ